ncbi:hypothetical protein LOK74_09275 [Brevibacillus humidisoli]|uniref:hypothetical protein n=1 Tax=Brevibacillus humidisoli TaxID=2895522 RepID=UPI001E556F3D|nr:hypothetical protein [Brevibacillus humidisoli]UFJ42660.1 hypothetical protein LOK74_09275 [Brevibacillus humidisoli]
MTTKSWRPVRKLVRKLGPVWVVRRTHHNHKQTGYFKFPTRRNRKYVGNLIANELISYRLAKLIDLNVANVELAKIRGRRGVVSIARPARHLYSWNRLHRMKGSAIHHLDHPEQLLRTFVFDVWICNVDRHGGNLITFPRGKRYGFYLIDHGLALDGALKWRKRPWNSSYWTNVWRYNRHYVRGLLSYVRNYRQLVPYIKQIQRIPSRDIEAAIDAVPASILDYENRQKIKKMLLYRQRNLDWIIKKWAKEGNKSVRDVQKHVSESSETETVQKQQQRVKQNKRHGKKHQVFSKPPRHNKQDHSTFGADYLYYYYS